jgi:hypothetical protein
MNCQAASRVIMKIGFWIFVVLLVGGGGLAGYWSGHYEGVRKTSIETQLFLRELGQETDLENYLKGHGQEKWADKLRVYGIGGPTSYLHSRGDSVTSILVGITCVTVGIGGLLSLLRREHVKPAARG